MRGARLLRAFYGLRSRELMARYFSDPSCDCCCVYTYLFILSIERDARVITVHFSKVYALFLYMAFAIVYVFVNRELRMIVFIYIVTILFRELITLRSWKRFIVVVRGGSYSSENLTFCPTDFTTIFQYGKNHFSKIIRLLRKIILLSISTKACKIATLLNRWDGWHPIWQRRDSTDASPERVN